MASFKGNFIGRYIVWGMIFSAIITEITTYVSDTYEVMEGESSTLSFYIIGILSCVICAVAQIFVARYCVIKAKEKADYGLPEDPKGFFTKFVLIMIAVTFVCIGFVLISDINNLYAPYDEIDDATYINVPTLTKELEETLKHTKYTLITGSAINFLISTAGYIVSAIVITRTFTRAGRNK